MSARLAGAALGAGLVVALAACSGGGDAARDLLFVSTRDGDYAVFSMSAAGDDETRVTEEGGDPSSPQGLFFQIEPSVSPDGRTIAFASKREGTFDIYVMSADGTETRRLTSTPHDDANPTWSADGARIAFARGAGDIYVMNADGSGVRAVTQSSGQESEPAWSPDGGWIAFARRAAGTSIRELWLVRPDGSGLRQITSLSAVSTSPAWSPRGDRIAFSTDFRNTQFDIYSIGVDGTERQRVTTTAEDTFEPAWGPDGTIAFSERGSIYAVEDGNDEARELTGAENDSDPAWWPVTEDGGD